MRVWVIYVKFLDLIKINLIFKIYFLNWAAEWIILFYYFLWVGLLAGWFYGWVIFMPNLLFKICKVKNRDKYDCKYKYW